MACEVQWEAPLETLASCYEHAGITTSELGNASKRSQYSCQTTIRVLFAGWEGVQESSLARAQIGRGAACGWIMVVWRLVPCMAAARLSLAGPAAGRDCHVVNLRALSGPSCVSSLVGWLRPELLHLAGAEHQDERGNDSEATRCLSCHLLRASLSSFTRCLHAWDLSGVYGPFTSLLEEKKRWLLAAGSRDARKWQDPLLES